MGAFELRECLGRRWSDVRIWALRGKWFIQEQPEVAVSYLFPDELEPLDWILLYNKSGVPDYLLPDSEVPRRDVDSYYSLAERMMIYPRHWPLELGAFAGSRPNRLTKGGPGQSGGWRPVILPEPDASPTGLAAAQPAAGRFLPVRTSSWWRESPSGKPRWPRHRAVTMALHVSPAAPTTGPDCAPGQRPVRRWWASAQRRICSILNGGGWAR